MKAIIIDDNQRAIDDLQNRLQKYALVEVVAVATTGLDGLARVSECQPDLLFLDVQLPDISGLDFLERVDSFTHGQCRVVMYTAYDEFVLPAFRRKAFDVLLKPIDPQELEIVMRRLAESEPERQQPVDVPSTETGGQEKGKFLLYTNTVDFKLVDKRDIALFQYNHEVRCWEAVVAGIKQPIRMKRTIKSNDLVSMDAQFIQVNQSFVVNMNYLIEVVDNVCHFYPPFDNLDYVKVGRLFRRKLVERFYSL